MEFRPLELTPRASEEHVLKCKVDVQAKLGPLTADHPAVESGGVAEPLPTWSEFRARVSAAKQLTVRDVWGLMLTSVPGARVPWRRETAWLLTPRA